MTHTIHHQYDELLPASLPGLEIHIVYNCESEIAFDEEGGEETNRLITMRASVNNRTVGYEKFPREEHGSDARKFLGNLRDNARQALWAKALEKASAWPVQEMHMVAHRWQVTGSTQLPTFGKPEHPHII